MCATKSRKMKKQKSMSPHVIKPDVIIEAQLMNVMKKKLNPGLMMDGTRS
jgi:hypothetical protein